MKTLTDLNFLMFDQDEVVEISFYKQNQQQLERCNVEESPDVVKIRYRNGYETVITGTHAIEAARIIVMLPL